LPDQQKTTGLVSGLFVLAEGGDRYTYYLKEFAGVNPENGDALWYKNTVNPTTHQEEKTVTNNYKEAVTTIPENLQFRRYMVDLEQILPIKE
jgi:hypothetical protein